jgi:hypothetical protein
VCNPETPGSVFAFSFWRLLFISFVLPSIPYFSDQSVEGIDDSHPRQGRCLDKWAAEKAREILGLVRAKKANVARWSTFYDRNFIDRTTVAFARQLNLKKLVCHFLY